jgi:hypothetical protein
MIDGAVFAWAKLLCRRLYGAILVPELNQFQSRDEAEEVL